MRWLGSKIFGAMLLILVVGGGFVWVLRTFLAPPAAQVPPGQPAAPVSNDPFASPPVSPVAAPPVADPEPEVVTNPGADNTSQLPAIAQDTEVVIQQPNRVEKGGILKIFVNNSDDASPDPLLFSPSRVLKVDGLTLINTNNNEFQEVSGFFKVPADGLYNITAEGINTTSNYLPMLIRVDGIGFRSWRGGQVDLQQGWHQIRVFLNSGASWDGNLFEIKLGREGEPLKRLAVYREVGGVPGESRKPSTSSPAPVTTEARGQ